MTVFKSAAGLGILAIAAWGILLIKFWVFGQLYLLVHPNYIPLTVMAGFLLLLISGGKAWQLIRSPKVNQKISKLQHSNLFPSKLSSGLLLGAAIIGLVITPKPFASDTAIHRGVGDNLGAIRSVPQSFRASNRPEERSLIEWVRTINVYPEPDAYTGQKVKVQGFAVHPQDVPEQVMLISRFIITCCAADVYPVSLPVKFDPKLGQSRSNYPADRWFEIAGTMITETINGKRQLTIQPVTITAIAEPKNPYDY
jgi:uncharacterized repeat protein (TIGR03943 family)